MLDPYRLVISFIAFINIVCCLKIYQGRRQRGAISRLAPGCYIHPVLYFKSVPPSGFWPLLLVFGPTWC